MDNRKKVWAFVACSSVVLCAWAARMEMGWRARDAGSTHIASAAYVSAAVGNQRANGSQPLTPGNPFVLVGEIADLPDAAAPVSVVARVGDQVFPAQVQGRSFQVQVADGTGTALVRIEVTAPRTRYEAWLGSAPLLRSLAGSDKQLVPAEHALLRVSAYSTSLAVLGQFALGGRAPNSDAELERAMRSVITEDLEGSTYLLSGMASGEISLPPGYATGFQALGNRNVFRTLLQNPAYRQASAGVLDAQAAPAPLRSLSELPERLVFTGALPADMLPMGTADVMLLQRQSASQSLLYENIPLATPSYGLNLTADGSLELLPTTAYTDIHADPISGASVQRQRVKYRFKRLYKGAQFDHWVVTAETLERTLPDGLAKPVVRHSIMTSVDLARWALPQWPTPSRWALRTGCSQRFTGQAGFCMMADHFFKADNHGELDGQNIKFSRSDLGRISPQYSGPFDWSWDAATRSMNVSSWQDVAWTYWRVEGALYDAGPVLYLMRDLGGDQSASVGLDFTVPLLGFGRMDGNKGTWMWADYRAEARRYQGVDDTFVLEQDYGGLAMHRDSRRHGELWQPLNSVVVEGAWYQVEAELPPPLTSCINAAIYPCTSKATYFRPVMRVGQRYYGVRDRVGHTFTSDGSNELYLLGSDTTFVDCIGGTCLEAESLPDMDKWKPMSPPATPPAAARPLLRTRPAALERKVPYQRELESYRARTRTH